MTRTPQNSLVTYLTGYVGAMFKDIKPSYLHHSDWERDLSRLQHELAVRGSRVLTLELPALCKHFEKCLDQGLYIPSGLFLGRVRKAVQVPVFMRDLYLQIFDLEGKLRGAPNVDVIKDIQALLMSVKSLRLPFTDRSLQNEVHNFTRIEQETRRPDLNWGGDELFDVDPNRATGVLFAHTGADLGGSSEGRSYGAGLFGEAYPCDIPTVGLRRLPSECGEKINLHFRDGDRRDTGLLFEFARGDKGPTGPEFHNGVLWDALQRVADGVSAQFGDLSLERDSELPKHGPGVTADGKSGISKYRFVHWPRKLDAQFPMDLYSYADFGIGEDPERDPCWSLHEAPSRLIAVPKTQKGPRLIAAEPISHQWIQQLVWNQLEGRLKQTQLRNVIAFRDQTVNGGWARRASIDGSSATIDLSAASDRLSCWVIERAFRTNPSLLLRLHACRTRWLTYKSGTSKEYIILKKFAPMGSAVTFPVQSIIYAMVAITCVIVSRGQKVTTRSIERASSLVRVFGDDIVVPSDSCKLTMDCLEGLGLRVNVDKTFGTGKFRESCGVRAYAGHDVTPPYLRDGPSPDRFTTLGSFLAVRNNFYKKGFWHVAYWLDDQIARYHKWIPDVHVGERLPGRASFLGSNTSMCLKRYNKALQRSEFRTLIPVGRRTLGPAAGTYRLFQWFIEEPQPDLRWSSGPIDWKASFTRPGWMPEEVFSTNPKGSGEPQFIV